MQTCSLGNGLKLAASIPLWNIPILKKGIFGRRPIKSSLMHFLPRHLNEEKLIWSTKLRNSGQWSKASPSSAELRKGIEGRRCPLGRCVKSLDFLSTFGEGGCHLNERSCLVEAQQRKHAKNESNACSAWFHSLVTQSVFRTNVTRATLCRLNST